MAQAIVAAIGRTSRERRHVLRGPARSGPRAYKVTIWFQPERYDELMAEKRADHFDGSLTKYLEHRLETKRAEARARAAVRRRARTAV
jgi:hypothetical protein